MAHIKPTQAGGTIRPTLITGSGNTETIKEGKIIAAGDRQLILQTMMIMHEYYRVKFSGESTASGAAMAINYVTTQVEALGQTDTVGGDFR